MFVCCLDVCLDYKKRKAARGGGARAGGLRAQGGFLVFFFLFFFCFYFFVYLFTYLFFVLSIYLFFFIFLLLFAYSFIYSFTHLSIFRISEWDGMMIVIFFLLFYTYTSIYTQPYTLWLHSTVMVIIFMNASKIWFVYFIFILLSWHQTFKVDMLQVGV